MSRSSISWHTGRLVGSSSPRCQSPPPLKNGFPLVASTVACIANLVPKQACVPASSHVVEHLPTSTPAVGPEQLQSLQVIGGELDPSEIVGDGPTRRVRVVPWVGWMLVVVSPWSPRSADVTTIRCPRPGDLKVERDWIVVCLVTETSPDDLGVSGSMGRCPPDHDPAAGTGHHPTRMISRRPRLGGVSPPKGVVRLTQGGGRLPQAGQHGSDSKQGKNWMATDLRISVPMARLPSTAIHWHLLLCGRPDAWGHRPAHRRPRATAVQHLTREAAPSALQTSAGRCSRGWVWLRRRTTLPDPTTTSATAPPERTWTASSATSRTGSHTHTASSLSNAVRLSHHRQHTYH
jgi:hypothetical protein